VQGRISLAIGRALDVLGRDKDPRIADQIQGGIVALISIITIVFALILWEKHNKKRERASQRESGAENN
jgi:hypothetical protein